METIFGLSEIRAFTLRRCLWLCLPALVVGAVLRISLLTAIPEAFFGSDSGSYSRTTEELYLKGQFNMPAKRRYVYPVLLIAAPPVPFCNTVQVVAAVQHTGGLAIIVGIGWIAGHLVRRPSLWVPVVTLFAAVWPHMLYYEHEMISECLVLGVLIATLAIAAPPGGLVAHRRLGWFLVLAVVIMAVKPAGRPLWLGLFVAAMFLTRRPLLWPRWCFLTVPVAVLIAMTSGGDKQGPWLFLSSTLPLVRAEGEPYARERALLRPAIEEARADLPNYAFNQSMFKKRLTQTKPGGKLGPEYAKFCRDDARFTKVASTLGREAVLAHPVEYARLVLQKALIAASGRDHDKRLLPAGFWSDQQDSSDDRWQERPQQMAVVYEMDEPAYRALVAERAQRTLWFEPLVTWLRRIQWVNAEAGPAGEQPRIALAPLGWLFVIGVAGALVPGRFTRTSILWLPLGLYLFIVFAVGDRVSRYLEPVEAVMFILIVISLDVALDALIAMGKKLRRPAIAPALVA
ncbi:MAG: hypothetical protein K8R23_02380 [Chthoniobacter sp.]|nr:hypothetical protein [Chthoniobacter sp.]